MKTYRGVSAIGTVLLVLGTAVGSASAAGPALNILVYGNSFVNNTGLPYMFANFAQGFGQTRPVMVNAAVNSQALSFHIAATTSIVAPNTSVTNYISDNSLNKNCSGKWDYVILQEYSTKPTNITYASLGNPTAFKADAKTLYQMVAADSPKVTPVLMETWARQPGNTDLGRYYSGLTGTAAANQMQSELHQYYGEARAGIGNSIMGLASVGDAFQTLNFDARYYAADLYHESYPGAALACLILYDTIYHDTASRFSYDTVNGLMGWDNLSRYGVTSADWPALVAAADAAASPAAVPEPSTLTLLGVAGVLLLLVRRRR
jgi:hypothetical protein